MNATHNRRAGFTVVEIMLVVATIGLLAIMSMPAFLKSRRTVQNTRFIADLRVACDAFDQFAMVTGNYPPTAADGATPVGMEDYLRKMHWNESTTLGGQWDWDRGVVGTSEGISVIAPSADAERFAEMDRQIDDGDVVTGSFRRRGDGRGYIFLTGI